MDPELAQKAIEGYQNELAPEQLKLEAFYRQFRCQRCKGQCRKEYNSQHAFADPDSLIPRALLRCTECEALFDPFNGLLIERGKEERTQEE
jgi:hypothetical protein